MLLSVACLANGTNCTGILRSADEIADACQARRSGCPIDTTGQLLIPPVHLRIGFPVEINGKIVSFSDCRTNRTDALDVGDRVRILGFTKDLDIGTSTFPQCTEIQVLSKGSLPKPPLVDTRRFQSGAYANQHVAIRGQIRDVFPDDIDQRYVFIVLEASNQLTYLIYTGLKDQVTSFRSLIGSEVIATGVGISRGLGRRARLLANQSIHISGTNSLTVIHRPDADRFAVEELDPSEDFDLRVLSSTELRKTRGTVLATWHGDTCLIQADNGNVIKVDFAETPIPNVGMTIEAVGHPETDLFDFGLSRAFWRESDYRPATSSRPVDSCIRSLFTNKIGARTIQIEMHGKLLRLRGSVKGLITNERGGKSILLEEGDFSIIVDCEALPSFFERIDVGCAIEVTGVCIRDGDVWRPNIPIPKVRGLFLVPQTPEDIRILSKPSWWTPARFSAAITGLLILLALILVWNATLRALVTRKSRALLREQAMKLSETLKITERTRLSAELHDFHSQSLTAISYQISSARNACKSDPAAAEQILSTAIHMLKSCRTELRRCLWDLRSDVLNEPDFAEAIRKTLRPVAGTATLSVRFAGRRTQISDTTAHTVLSILRELTANAVNHGRATSVRIAGEHRLQTLRFSIADNGVGFDPANRPGQDVGHFGLDGIVERLNRLDGSIDIESAPGRGTYIRISISSAASSHPTSQPLNFSI